MAVCQSAHVTADVPDKRDDLKQTKKQDAQILVYFILVKANALAEFIGFSERHQRSCAEVDSGDFR